MDTRTSSDISDCVGRDDSTLPPDVNRIFSRFRIFLGVGRRRELRRFGSAGHAPGAFQPQKPRVSRGFSQIREDGGTTGFAAPKTRISTFAGKKIAPEPS